MCTAINTRAVYTREELLALSRIGHGIKLKILTELKSCTVDAELEQNEMQRGTTGGGGTNLSCPL